MPDIELYSFPHRELLELLIKKAGVHDGKWMLQVNFGFAAGNFGPDEKSDPNPGALIVINHLAIVKAPMEAPAGLVLDAAVVNPVST